MPLGKSFREEQCEKYNSPNYLDYNGNMKQWIPKYAGVSPRDRCKLFCRARGSSEFKVFESKVTCPNLAMILPRILFYICRFRCLKICIRQFDALIRHGE